MNAPGPAFQLVFAHPAGTPDRFRQFVDRLQGSVSFIDRFIAWSSAGTPSPRKFLRFVMGTRCGSRYVRIVDWKMPRVRSDYVLSGTGINGAGRAKTLNWGLIQLDAPTALGQQPGRNMLVYADELFDSNLPDGGQQFDFGAISQGFGIGDSTPGPQNTNNRGTQLSFVLGSTLLAPGFSGWEDVAPDLLLHEASHALGAVSYDAPHSTGAGQCTVNYDLMCYPDGGPHGADSDMVTRCPLLPPAGFGAIPSRYDCTGDDYFNPDPAPGSYLATHWNLYDSLFMAPCSENPVACGYTPAPYTRATTLTLGTSRIPVRARVVTHVDGSVTVTVSEQALPAGVSGSLCERSDNGGRCARTHAGARSRRPLKLTVSEPASRASWRTVNITADANVPSRRRPLTGSTELNITIP